MKLKESGDIVLLSAALLILMLSAACFLAWTVFTETVSWPLAILLILMACGVFVGMCRALS